jgi:hypothetical protein
VLTKVEDVVVSSWVLTMQEVELINTHNKVHKQNLLKNQKIHNTNILCCETLSHQKSFKNTQLEIISQTQSNLNHIHILANSKLKHN